MNGSHSQHHDEPQDEDLGLDLVDQVASSSRAETTSKPKRWIIGVVGVVIVVVLALVIFSLLNGGTKASKAAKADDAVTQTIELKNGGQAILSSSKTEDAIGVELSGLPALEDGQQYVVWAVHDETGASVIASSTGDDEDAGLSPANDVLAIHITVEGSSIPSAPSEETEASVDLPLDPAASESPQEDNDAGSTENSGAEG
ncbi:anti-sigma factor [Glutamicibacter sp. NPDC087344]|uniref:anti-sigma factor n=1 Tax=Glutamicibacter sp. NPDC087344 TaxID=3363994 RepID=UPI00382C8E89